MRFGINLMAWSAGVSAEELALLPRLAEMGYDGVELPLLQPDLLDPVAIHAALRQAGLRCTASSAMPRGGSLLIPSEHPIALAWLDRCCRVAAACGATLLCGPLYSPVGLLAGRPRTAGEWDACVQGLRAVGKIAERYGIIIALEPLNRFETYFLNTAADALRLTEEVDHPLIGILLDTFHMNIEEQDPAAAITQVGPHLVHFHASANDRGTVGSGHIDWSATAQALHASGYAGLPETWMVAETFSAVLPELAAATAIWRRIIPDPWLYARASLAAMHSFMERTQT